MNLFQLGGIILLALLAVASLRSYRTVRLRFPGLLIWWSILILGALALVFPNSTTVLAHHIGIERGADFLFYCAILAGLFIAFIGYLRIRILDRQITQLVRQHALDNARAPSKQNDSVNLTAKEVTNVVEP